MESLRFEPALHTGHTLVKQKHCNTFQYGEKRQEIAVDLFRSNGQKAWIDFDRISVRI